MNFLPSMPYKKVIPVWKRELLKKLHSNSKLEVDSNTITDDQLVISDPIVKVSQNIFVVRETKAGNSIKQRVHVTSKFQQQPSFSVIKTEDVIIIENTQQPITTRTESPKMDNTEPVADDKPTQGIVSRLKNRFMNDRTAPPQFNNKYKKVSVSFPPKKSTPEVEHAETTTTTIAATADKKLPVSSIDDNSTDISLSRRTNSEIELFSTANESPTNGDVIKSSSSSSSSPATNPPRKFDHRSRATSIDLLAPKGYKPATTTSIHQVKSLSPTKRESPKEKVPATKVEARSVGLGSSRVELTGKVKVDSTHISVARANAYNELMEESRTFQIIPKSAKASNIPPAAAAPGRAPSPARKSSAVDDLPCTDIDDLVDLSMVAPPEDEPRTPEPTPIVLPPPVAMDVKILPRQQPEVVCRTKAPSPPPPPPPASEYKEQKVAPVAALPQPVVADPPAPAARFRPQIQSAKSTYGTRSISGTGRTFTIDPSKYKRSAAPPVQSNAAKSREANDNTMTIVPKISAPRQPVATIPEVDIVKKAGRRKPAVDQIEVVGGYVKLSRSLLKHSGGKKKSVRILIDNKEFTPGQGIDVNANSNNNNNNNNSNNNSNNNNSKFFNRNRMYIPNSERNLDDKTDRFTEIRLDSPPGRNPIDNGPPPPLPAKKKMEEKFVSYIDDHDLDVDSSSTSSSSSEDIQALPTTADSAAFFSDVTTNDLLF